MGIAYAGKCPRCSYELKRSKEIFRRRLTCSQCGAVLHLSLLYLRCLFVASAIIGLTFVALVTGIRNPIPVFLFGIPLGFIVLMALIRVVPSVMMPVFSLRDPEDATGFTTLDLTVATQDPGKTSAGVHHPKSPPRKNAV